MEYFVPFLSNNGSESFDDTMAFGKIIEQSGD